MTELLKQNEALLNWAWKAMVMCGVFAYGYAQLWGDSRYVTLPKLTDALGPIYTHMTDEAEHMPLQSKLALFYSRSAGEKLEIQMADSDREIKAALIRLETKMDRIIERALGGG